MTSHEFSPFRHATGREGNILPPSATMASAETSHKTFEPTDLTSTYSVCTRRVFGSTGHRTQAFRLGESDALVTRLPTALKFDSFYEFKLSCLL
ncbi:hypothetical protein TNCV_1911701 [Trichonephila clavipes]|nr:hypothetical protein TNCV_1911701 [Trichonephila clavipes]